MSREKNPYLEWLKQMPEENKEHFLNVAFDRYLLAWSFEDKTEKIIQKEIDKLVVAYMETAEFQAKVKAAAEKMLSDPTDCQAKTIRMLIADLQSRAEDC